MSLFLLGISHLFSYLWLFPICYWLLGNRFELLETNLPLTHSTIEMLQGKVRLGLCFDCSYNESSHPSTGCRLVPLHPKWKSHRLLCVRPVPRNPRLDYPLWGIAVAPLLHSYLYNLCRRETSWTYNIGGTLL